jgi:hypothetical protein
MWQTRGWTGIGLSNITSVTAVNVLFLLLYSGCATNQRSVPSGYIHRGGRCPLLCSGTLLSEEVCGVGDEGSGDTATVNVQAPLKALFSFYHSNV